MQHGSRDLSHPQFGATDSDSLRTASKAAGGLASILSSIMSPMVQMLHSFSRLVEHHAEGEKRLLAISPTPQSSKYAIARISSRRSRRSGLVIFVSRRLQPLRLLLSSRKSCSIYQSDYGRRANFCIGRVWVYSGLIGAAGFGTLVPEAPVGSLRRSPMSHVKEDAVPPHPKLC